MQHKLIVLKEESRKLRQLVETNNDEIATLRKAHH